MLRRGQDISNYKCEPRCLVPVEWVSSNDSVLASFSNKNEKIMMIFTAGSRTATVFILTVKDASQVVSA